MAGDDAMLVDSDDDMGNAQEAEAQREAWERAYEADRCEGFPQNGGSTKPLRLYPYLRGRSVSGALCASLSAAVGLWRAPPAAQAPQS